MHVVEHVVDESEHAQRICRALGGFDDALFLAAVAADDDGRRDVLRDVAERAHHRVERTDADAAAHDENDVAVARQAQRRSQRIFAQARPSEPSVDRDAGQRARVPAATPHAMSMRRISGVATAYVSMFG